MSYEKTNNFDFIKHHFHSQKSTSSDETKVKQLISDLISYYKEKNEEEENNPNYKIFYHNAIWGSDLLVYMNQNTDSIIKKYGEELYITTVELDNIKRDQGPLKKHEIASNSRTKMVNWMMDIFASYSSEPLSFFLAVDIMDNYLTKTKKVYKDKDIHIIGLVAIYLASRMEDIIPLHMVHIKTKLGGDKFSAEEIIELEKDMLNTLNWEIISITTYDVIKTFLADFQVNNKEMAKKLKLDTLFYDLEIVSIFLTKLIALHEAFSKYHHCVKGIAIIIAAFDIVRSNYTLKSDCENYVRQWLLFLVKESKFTVNIITGVYNKICKFYEDINNVNKVAPTLLKIHNLKEWIKPL